MQKIFYLIFLIKQINDQASSQGEIVPVTNYYLGNFIILKHIEASKRV